MDIDAPRRFGPIGAPSAAVMLAILATALAPPARAADDIWQRDKLTGDWGGVRTQLSQRGFDITFNYIGETLAVLSGGFRRGADYEHRFELSIDTDLGK